MNSGYFFPNLWRFLGLLAIQVFVLKQIPAVVGYDKFNILLYPLFIFFLPLQISRPAAVALGFLMGLAVDIPYGSPGVHASAGAFSAYFRPVLMGFMAPRGGLTGKEVIPSPEYFGVAGYLQAAGLFFLLHLFWYFSVEAFTFVYIGQITLKVLVAWPLSMIFVFFYGFLFNPKV